MRNYGKSILINNENVRYLHRLFGELKPDEYREVLNLICFQGCSIKETVAIMKKTEKQVRNLLYRAKESWQNILEKEGFENEGL